MVRRSNMSFLAGLMLVPMMAASPLSASHSQEAIMLETLGAVRMAPPQEVQRMNDEAARLPERRLPAADPRQHADATR